MTTLNTIIEEEKKEFDGCMTSLDRYGGFYHGNKSGVEIYNFDNIKTFVTTAMQRAYQAGQGAHKKEMEEVLHALAQMYMQYCGDKSGHAFMTAGEDAQYVLERFGILKGANEMGGEGEIDWEALTSIITRYKEELLELDREETNQGFA